MVAGAGALSVGFRLGVRRSRGSGLEEEEEEEEEERPRRVSGLKGWVWRGEGMIVSQIMAREGGVSGWGDG